MSHVAEDEITPRSTRRTTMKFKEQKVSEQGNNSNDRSTFIHTAPFTKCIVTPPNENTQKGNKHNKRQIEIWDKL